jgi:hypothetical protein
MKARQLLTLSGLAAVVLIAVGFAISGDAPGTGDDAATVKAFYLDHTSGQKAGGYLLMIAVPLLLLFASSLRTALARPADDASALWANLVLAGGAIAGVGFLLTACLQFALASSPKNFSSSAMQALNALASYGWVGFTGGIGVLLLGAAGAMIPLATGLRWLGWVALLLGVVIFTPIGFLAFAGSGVWVVLTSVALTMRQRDAKPVVSLPMVTGS